MGDEIDIYVLYIQQIQSQKTRKTERKYMEPESSKPKIDHKISSTKGLKEDVVKTTTQKK